MQKIKIKIKILICTALILLSGGMLFSCDARVKNVCAYDVIELSYGSPLDLNNLVLKVEYSNGRIKTFKYSEIKKDIKIVKNPYSSTSSEVQDITLEYKGKEFKISVQVQEPKINNIVVNTSALGRVVNIEKVTDLYIQNFLNKISVSAIKQDSSSELLNSSDYKVLNYDNLTGQVSTTLDLNVLKDVGEHWFAVLYKDFNPKLFSLTVKLGDENGFTINRDKIPTRILKGEEVDFSKLLVSATFTDGRTSKLTVGTSENNYKLDLNGFDNSVAGKYTIKVKYKSYIEKTFTIDVVDVIDGE